jgi:hypothetical protein
VLIEQLCVALQRATRPGAAFDADLCRSVLTACCRPSNGTASSASAFSSSAEHSLLDALMPGDSASASASAALGDEAQSSSVSGRNTPDADKAPPSLADEFALRLRSAVVGALTSISATTGGGASTTPLLSHELGAAERGAFIETAAGLVGRLERSEPDVLLWLPYVAAIASVGGALAIAPALRRLLVPATLAAVVALRAKQRANDELVGSPLSPPISPPRAGATSPPPSADERRMQRYARIERADRVRQSYVAVLTVVLKEWRALPLLPRNVCKSLLLLCELPGAALVREVLLRHARDDPPTFWTALIAGIDPLLATQLATATPPRHAARRASAADASQSSTESSAASSPTARRASPLSASPLGGAARSSEAGPLSDPAASSATPIASEVSEAIDVDSARHRAMLAALFVALLAWRRAIDDDAQRARLGDAMLASSFLDQVRRVHGVAGIDTSSSLPFALRLLRIVTAAFGDIVISARCSAEHVRQLLELWLYFKRVGVASGCLSSVPMRDAAAAAARATTDDSDGSGGGAESDGDSDSDELDGVVLPRQSATSAAQRYHGDAFWSAFIGLTSHLHAAFPWHMQRALCDLTVNNASVAYRITSSLRCNPLLALVTHETELPPTAEAIQRLGSAREFERFAASLIVADDALGPGELAAASRECDESDLIGALEFERLMKRQQMAARLRAEVSSRSARLALASERLLESEYARQLTQLKDLFAEQQQAQRDLVAKKDAWTSKLQTRIENLITINNRLTEQCKQAVLEAASYRELSDERQTKLRDAADRLVRARIEADDQQQELREAREQVQVLTGLVLDSQQQREAIESGAGTAALDGGGPCANCAQLGAQLSAAERRRVQAEQALAASELRVLELSAREQQLSAEREAARAQFQQLGSRLEAERDAAAEQVARQRESRTALSERVLELSERIDSLTATTKKHE